MTHTEKVLLSALFWHKYEVINHETVDDFYAYLGYNLELYKYIETYIQSASMLKDILEEEIEG